MAKERSTKPYLIRAICEWCGDSGLTAYLSVRVDANTRVPMEYVKNGEIVLNISPDAAHRLTVGDDLILQELRCIAALREAFECLAEFGALPAESVFARAKREPSASAPRPAVASGGAPWKR